MVKRQAAITPSYWNLPGFVRSVYRAGLGLYVRLFWKSPFWRIEDVRGTKIIVLPGVFNGVLLRTGAFLANALDGSLIPRGARVLDLGTGSGICALLAARLGATVLATDINPEAVRCTQINALANHLESSIETRVGDLFRTVSEERFDVILFNPPFYRGRPRDLADSAWRSPDAFDRFLRELPAHLNSGGLALVVLSSDAEIESALAAASGLVVSIVRRQDMINETLTVYSVSIAQRQA